MIQLSDCFSMIGEEGCIDVASSLGAQGIDPSMGTTSIPIFEILYLKILMGDDCGFICDSIQEYTAVKEMNNSCGSVAITLNIMDMDMLTIIGALMVYTPSTGMNIFYKINDMDPTSMGVEAVGDMAKMINLPIPDGMIEAYCNSYEFVNSLREKLVQFVIQKIASNLEDNNIYLRPWEEIYDYYTQIKGSGEMAEMANYRAMIGAFVM